MKTWKNWFAWYPVAFGPHIMWFATVQRYYNTTERAWYYRIVPTAECVVPHVRKSQPVIAAFKRALAGNKE